MIRIEFFDKGFEDINIVASGAIKANSIAQRLKKERNESRPVSKVKLFRFLQEVS